MTSAHHRRAASTSKRDSAMEIPDNLYSEISQLTGIVSVNLVKKEAKRGFALRENEFVFDYAL
jgi:hypothetical protein